MKIIYSGGYDKYRDESVKASYVFTYAPLIKKLAAQGKKVAFITLAKPDYYFDSLLFPLYEGLIKIINSTNVKTIDWSSHDAFFLPGGSGLSLLEGLKSGNFSLAKVKKDALLLGDSAGAYVLSSYFYSSPAGTERGKTIEFIEGFNPDVKVITVAHKNNPDYCNDLLITKVKEFAERKGIRVLILNENEQKILQKGKFVEVNMDLLI